VSNLVFIECDIHILTNEKGKFLVEIFISEKILFLKMNQFQIR
jgi:hypothetical protein